MIGKYRSSPLVGLGQPRLFPMRWRPFGFWRDPLSGSAAKYASLLPCSPDGNRSNLIFRSGRLEREHALFLRFVCAVTLITSFFLQMLMTVASVMGEREPISSEGNPSISSCSDCVSLTRSLFTPLLIIYSRIDAKPIEKKRAPYLYFISISCA